MEQCVHLILRQDSMSTTVLEKRFTLSSFESQDYEFLGHYDFVYHNYCFLSKIMTCISYL